MAAKGRADGCQGGKEKHPWVKGMPSKGRADISYGGIGMPPTIHRRYRNTPITGIGMKHRRHSFVFGGQKKRMIFTDHAEGLSSIGLILFLVMLAIS